MPRAISAPRTSGGWRIRSSRRRRPATIPVRFLICDREFHLTIYYASTNRLLADFVVDLYTYMLDHRRIAMGKPGAIEKSLEDHRFIVNALKMRNPEAVSAAFANHILRIHDTSLDVDTGGRRDDPRRGESRPARRSRQQEGNCLTCIYWSSAPRA